MSKNKEFTELTKAQVLKLPNKPEFFKASLRVLEGDGFGNYESALNGATIVASKEEKADALYNGIVGFAREGRIIHSVGVTQREMEIALASDFYIINNIGEMLVKCTGKDVAEILKEAVKRSQQSGSALKKQIGFEDVKELTLKPITEYANKPGKFQRYMEKMKNERDEKTIQHVSALMDLKKFNVEKLFEFSKEVATARYYNIESNLLDGFEKEAAAAKLKKATGGFF